MNELAYVINVSKTSIDDVKNAFKTMLSDPTKKSQIFDIMNDNLKFSLQIDDASDLTSIKFDEILNIIIKVQ